MGHRQVMNEHYITTSVPDFALDSTINILFQVGKFELIYPSLFALWIFCQCGHVDGQVLRVASLSVIRLFWCLLCDCSKVGGDEVNK